MTDLQTENAALRARVAELEAALAQVDQISCALGLTPLERRLTAALLAASPGYASKNRLLLAGWGTTKFDGLGVNMTRLRRALGRHGIGVDTGPRVIGWRLSPEDAEKVRAVR